MMATSIQTANLQAIWSEFQTTTAKKKKSMNLREMRVKREMRQLVGHEAGILIKIFIQKSRVLS